MDRPGLPAGLRATPGERKGGNNMFKKESLLLGLLITTAAAVVAIPVGIMTALTAEKMVEDKQKEA